MHLANIQCLLDFKLFLILVFPLTLLQCSSGLFMYLMWVYLTALSAYCQKELWTSASSLLITSLTTPAKLGWIVCSDCLTNYFSHRSGYEPKAVTCTECPQEIKEKYDRRNHRAWKSFLDMIYKLWCVLNSLLKSTWCMDQEEINNQWQRKWEVHIFSSYDGW